ncbi:MAG: MoxR family ATPase [Gemmatimonadales bacterium]|nr:MoxR family ATPase [Gemmatimonadales bacterium]
MTDTLAPDLARFAAGSALARADELAHESQGVRRALEALGRVVVGQRELLERMILGLLADGHILLEGLPGLAKTLAVKTLATTIHGDCRRVQFTPDLLPGDLVGTLVYNQRSGEFSVQRGPIFTNILLADEINRAPAKVQSALLEAMQERQVTIGNETQPLPELFLVLATQNPIEQEGTYPLPEAQVDRFMFKVVVTYPARADERAILDLMTGGEPPVTTPVLHPDDILRARKVVDSVYVDDRIKEYVLDLITATRTPAEAGLGELGPLIGFGASPRAAIYLVKAAKAHAFLEGRAWVAPGDVKAVGPDVLRHRLVPTYRADAEGMSADRIVERILAHVPTP